MKSIPFFILLTYTLVFFTMPCSAKREKHKPKSSHEHHLIDEQKQELHNYQPNPIILSGVSQIVNGALNIAQDPHSRPNIGHSVASMVHGIATIIIEKLAHKKIDITDQQALEEYCEEICLDITKEIDDIINAQSTTHPHF